LCGIKLIWSSNPDICLSTIDLQVLIINLHALSITMHLLSNLASSCMLLVSLHIYHICSGFCSQTPPVPMPECQCLAGHQLIFFCRTFRRNRTLKRKLKRNSRLKLDSNYERPPATKTSDNKTIIYVSIAACVAKKLHKVTLFFPNRPR
jgi:hypothetical protein